MAIEHRLQCILQHQAPSGAFPSTVHLPDGEVTDENGFMTALVLRELAPLRHLTSVRQATESGLDFLLRCECADRPGAFCFYPPDGPSEWIGLMLPPDADDTALYSVILTQYQRRGQRTLERAARDILGPFRRFYLPGSAPIWERTGAYLTWLDERHQPNDVDLCANINVLTLLHLAGGAEAQEGISAIFKLLEAGLDWAGASIERLRQLTPYYAHPIELYAAIDAAISAGVEALEPYAQRLRTLSWVTDDGPVNRPICQSRDGHIYWTCETLLQARRLLGSQGPDGVASCSSLPFGILA